MSKRYPDAPKPTWFRLSAESWAMIRDEYVGGATARELAKKYRTSPGSIYRHACAEGWTKEAMGESVSRRSVAAADDEAARRIADAVKRETEVHAWIEQVAAEEEPLAMADALERRALAEASAALVQGRSKDARDLASLAEQMRKHRGERAAAPVRVSSAAPALSAEDLAASVQAQLREAIAEGRTADAKSLVAIAEQLRKGAEEAQAAEMAEAQEEELDKSDRVALMMEFFGRSAYLAGCMVHNPGSAPGAFLRQIKRWREINLGEGEADAEAAAAKVATAKQRHLDGSWVETTPEDVRAYLLAQWDEVRLYLDDEPPNWGRPFVKRGGDAS